MRRYKRYLEDDDAVIPRSTTYFRRARIQEHEEPDENQEFNVDVPANGTDSDENGTDGAQSIIVDNEDIEDNAQHVTDGEPLPGDTEPITVEEPPVDEPFLNISDQQPHHEDASDDENDIFMEAQNFEVEDMIYPGAFLTRTQSSALILAYAIRHHITEIALTDLLHLINAHTPTVIHQSKYYFFQDLKEDTVSHHFYCENEKCRSPIKFLNNTTIDQCTNELCDLFGLDQYFDQLRKNKCFFLHLPLRDQLAKLLNNPDFFSKLSKDNHASGVTSGVIYKQHVESGKIGPIDITLQWNTDGASAAKSSKCSIWPIQVAINELSYQERKENILLTGLWQGTKPQMNTFLRPFVDELQELHTTGIVLDDGRIIKVHCVIGTVDSVARPLLQNIKQYNGKHGCSFCLAPGECIERGNGISRVYRGEVGEPRSEDQHLRDIDRVIDHDLESSNGVKGPSLLLLLPIFNIITSFVPDYMHNVLLGVVRWFLFQWVDGANSAKAWYLGGNKANQISNRLVNIKPPGEITRPPRTLEDKKLWKASEFRSFLLYYSLPCLKDILPNRYLKHWLLLVFAMTTMLKDKILAPEFELAKAALTNFVMQIEDLYGQEFMTYNMHTLLHLPESVKNWGAPWDSSTFMFEHFNGVLLNLFSGTQHISGQIFKNYNRVKLMNSILNKSPFQNWHPEAVKLLKNLSGKYLSMNAVRIDRVVLLGAGKLKQLSLPEQLAIERLWNRMVTSVNVRVYARCIFKGIKLHVVGYLRLIKRVNCIVRLQNNSFFEIHDILDMCDRTLPENENCIVLGKQLDILNNDICRNGGIRSSNFIKFVNPENNVLIAIFPAQILQKCVKIIVNDEQYICNLVNSYERD